MHPRARSAPRTGAPLAAPGDPVPPVAPRAVRASRPRATSNILETKPQVRDAPSSSPFRCLLGIPARCVYRHVDMRAAVTVPDVRPVSRLFKALGDETRVRIVALLSHGELCVCHVE